MRSAADPSGTVLGVDVGYSKTQPTTGLCVLAWDATAISLSFARCRCAPAERDGAIDRIVGGRELCAAAIDGPLTHGLRRVQHYRAAEALLSQGVLQKRGKPGQTSSPTGRELHHHATDVALSLIAKGIVGPSRHFELIHERSLVEAFPNMFLAALVDEERLPELRRDASDRYWEVVVHHTPRLEEIIAHLLPDRALTSNLRSCIDHEHRAALICALSALAVATGEYVAVGDPFDGDIVLPPQERWGASSPGGDAWMTRTLRSNLDRVRAVGRNHANHRHARIHQNGAPLSDHSRQSTLLPRSG